MKKIIFIFFILMLTVVPVSSQLVKWNPEDIILLTKNWEGERSSDGRPKVSDELLERLKKVSLEETYDFLRGKGYEDQFENFSSIYENGWVIIHPEQTMIGRAVTAQFMPMRFDFDDYLQEVGKKQDIQRVNNGLPLSFLSEGDVYVADAYGKISDGTLIGDVLGGNIYKATKRGVVFNGSVRKIDGLAKIEGFNGWVRGSDPSSINHMVCASVNAPIRIGRATVLPGDIVLAKSSGVIFIPPHFIVELIVANEVATLRTEFNTQRRDGKIDEKTDFREWINKQPFLPMTKAELSAYFTQLDNQRANPQPARSQRQ